VGRASGNVDIVGAKGPYDLLWSALWTYLPSLSQIWRIRDGKSLHFGVGHHRIRPTDLPTATRDTTDIFCLRWFDYHLSLSLCENMHKNKCGIRLVRGFRLPWKLHLPRNFSEVWGNSESFCLFGISFVLVAVCVCNSFSLFQLYPLSSCAVWLFGVCWGFGLASSLPAKLGVGCWWCPFC
jgi:hypothetical protein